MGKISTKGVLAFIIITFPIWDMIFTINSYYLGMNIPINQLARVCIALYLMTKITKKRDWVIMTILVTFLLIGEGFFSLNGSAKIVEDLGYMMKIISDFIFLFSIENLMDKEIIKKDDIIKWIVYASYFITISVILSVFGLGLKSWGEFGVRTGYKGLFSGQNVITATLIIINPLSFYMSYTTKKLKFIINYTFIFISLILVGTKAGMAGAFILLLIEGIYVLTKLKKTYFKIVISMVIVMLITAGVLTSKNYFINFYNEQKEIYNEFGYTNKINFLISNRNLQILYLKDYIMKNETSNNIMLFGLGYGNANAIINKYKSDFQAIEMDQYGVLYYSGIWVCIFILLYIFSRLYKSIYCYFKRKRNLFDFCIMISILVGIGHALFGGHVIYESLTSLYFMTILAIIKIEYKSIKSSPKGLSEQNE